MGLGKRFSYNTGKLGETTPGPGMYENVEPHSVLKNIEKSTRSSRSNPRLVFGVGRDT